MFTTALQTGANAQQLIIKQAGQRQRAAHSTGQRYIDGHKARQLWTPLCQGASFIKSHHVDPVCQLQSLCVFDQDAVLCRHPRTRHDGHRCGQAQRTRASNHQHRHGANQGDLQRLARKHPTRQRGQRHHQNHRHKYCADLVHQPLYRCFSGLRIFHQTDDVGQHGLRTHRCQADQYSAIAIDASAMDSRPWRFGNRHGLPGEHGFIGLRLAFADEAIGRKALACFNHHHVAHQQLGHRHIDFTIRAQPMCARGTQSMQCADGRGGLALGAHFQPFA